MRNPATRSSRVRFVGFLAGCTRIDWPDEQRIYRPGGMEGWILNCTIEGRAEVGRGETRFECGVGEVLLFPEGVVHDYGRLGGHNTWVHLWVHYLPRPSWGEWVRWTEAGGGVRRVTIGESHAWERIVCRMREIAELTRTAMRHKLDICMNAVEEVLLLCDESHTAAHGGAVDHRILDAAAYLREHYDERVTIADIAAYCSLSPSRLAHLFKQETDLSPMRYLEQLRICRAQELLLGTNLPIGQIADRCGFSNQLYFSHAFNRATGRSPRCFRRGR
jgi:AraC family transcriptional regulator, arabinose operon regulatory protein